jgi:adenylate cyclase
MTPDRANRRLAAILAADVAGYSRLMGADEEGTLAALKAHRKALVDPNIAEHRGHIVKTAGDGMLVEFASVVDAVRCAVEVQRGMLERNAAAPQEKRIEFRIGIHQGDIIIEHHDIFGDGVNIAARLEALAEPGGICVSGRVEEDVRGRLDLAFADIGEQQLKNIGRPVRVFALGAAAVAQLPQLPPAVGTLPASRFRSFRGVLALAGGLAALASLALAAWLAAWLAVRPAKAPGPSGPEARLSLVVLPFANLSGDPAQDYLADVLTEEVTTSVARIGGSFVIARSTAFAYKGKAVDAKQVGKDLGVRYLLEGSVEPSGNRVRLNAQLIDAGTGAHVWADRFDADRADLLEMQDEIVTRLSRALQLTLVEVDAARVARTRPGNLDAEDLAMRCEATVENTRPGSDEMQAGYNLCEQALERDGNNVRALIDLSFKFLDRVLEIQSLNREADIRQADELVSRALAIDPNAYAAHFAKAEVLLAQRRFEEAIVESERSLALNPSFVNAYNGLCTANSLLGRPEKSIEYADRAIRLSPRDQMLYVFYLEKGFALALLGQDIEAIEWLRRTVAMAPQWPLPQALLASALAVTGHEAEARETLTRYLSLGETRARTIAQWRSQRPSDNPVFRAYAERLAEGLRKAGMPD